MNIVDEPEEFYGGFGPYEDIDAANTCIDEFLDEFSNELRDRVQKILSM